MEGACAVGIGVGRAVVGACVGLGVGDDEGVAGAGVPELPESYVNDMASKLLTKPVITLKYVQQPVVFQVAPMHSPI